MTDADRWTPERIADYLNRLPLVEWDRGINAPVAGGEGEVVTIVYGWILREDGHRDYVQLDFVPWSDRPGFATSSARFSAEMHALIFGPEAAANHAPCVPVKEIPGLAALVTRTVPW